MCTHTSRVSLFCKHILDLVCSRREGHNTKSHRITSPSPISSGWMTMNKVQTLTALSNHTVSQHCTHLPLHRHPMLTPLTAHQGHLGLEVLLGCVSGHTSVDTLCASLALQTPLGTTHYTYRALPHHLSSFGVCSWPLSCSGLLFLTCKMITKDLWGLMLKPQLLLTAPSLMTL